MTGVKQLTLTSGVGLVHDYFLYHLKSWFVTLHQSFLKASGDRLLLSITVVDLLYLPCITREFLEQKLGAGGQI